MKLDGRAVVLGGICGKAWLLGNPWKEFTDDTAAVPPARKPRGIRPNATEFAGGDGERSIAKWSME